MATYLLRYNGVSISVAGLAVGAATVIGGLGGTILGSKVSGSLNVIVLLDRTLIYTI